MKNKKRFFVLLVLFVLLACAIAYYFFGRSNDEVPHFVVPDEFAEKWDGDQELPQGGNSIDVEIPGFTKLVFTADQTEQKVNFYNPESNSDNEFLLQFTLFANDKKLWQSGYCEAGHGYYDISLDEPLEKGEYDGILLVQVFTKEGKALNAAQIEHRIIVE